MPKMSAYIRVSTLDQTEGNSLDAQRAMCLRLGDDLTELHGAEWVAESQGSGLFDDAGLFVEQGVSAFKVPFMQRPAAAEMMQHLGEGDYLIVGRLDRAFRSVSDLSDVIRILKARGVKLMSCSPYVDSSTPHGMAMLQSLVVFFEWESAIKSQRMLQAHAAMREKNGGKPVKKKKTKLGLPQLRSEYRQPPDQIRAREEQKAEVLPKRMKTVWEASNATPYKNLHPEPPQPPKPGRIFGYTRNSNATSLKTGMGIEAMTKLAERYAQRLMETHPHLTEYIPGHEQTVSAYKTTFHTRPLGSKLWSELREGDHLVFARLDRGFRSVVDCLWTIDKLRKRGVTVHFADLNFDCNNPINRGFLAQGAIFCELESMFKGQRHKEAAAIAIAQGGIAPNKPPRARKVASRVRWINGKPVRKKRLIWDKRLVSIYRLYYHLYHYHQFTANDCMVWIEKIMAKRDGRPEIPVSGVNKRWIRKRGIEKYKQWKPDGLCYPPWFLKETWSGWARWATPEADQVLGDWYRNRGLRHPSWTGEPLNVPAISKAMRVVLSRARNRATSQTSVEKIPEWFSRMYPAP